MLLILSQVTTFLILICPANVTVFQEDFLRRKLKGGVGETLQCLSSACVFKATNQLVIFMINPYPANVENMVCS
jgi:hypothetical protein